MGRLATRIGEIVFQGNEPLPYLRAAMKLLFAGFMGVIVGWITQPFFTLVFGIPFWWAYWPAVICGFVVNLRVQILMKNLRIEKEAKKI